MRSHCFRTFGWLLGMFFSPAQAVPAASPPPAFQSAAGDLEIGLRSVTNGIRVTHLFDRREKVDLLAAGGPPLFELKLRRATDGREAALPADAGWSSVALEAGSNGFTLRWEQPLDEAMAGISVAATATAQPRLNAWHWRLRVNNTSQAWGLTRATFPQLAIADLGESGAAFFPRGPGEVQRGVWGRPFAYRGNYTDAWCAMQYMAVYGSPARPTGLYAAMHDPWGSFKHLLLASDPATRSLRLGFEHPTPGLGQPGTGFELGGEAVWRILRGDWFDAARIYREWASTEARWWPRLGPEGRMDTPAWMRELNAWGMSGGPPASCVPAVKTFQEFLGVPVGYHWYNWHQIPFDNDYPHYFPAKDGFPEGVANLQAARVFAMPYINGRLWDTHDRGAGDFEFAAKALAAAAKDLAGKPIVERYGSKETNGEPVTLAVMCPATALWQATVSNLVLRLLREAGTKAVYIDQVAAATPVACMDPTHGHPLGGGHWWNEGYWQMLAGIRHAMPPGAMLTTECNGEPFIRWFDGYLTWHWQHDGQVPAFPAVYGGTIQMFGRAYRGGPTQAAALRMKAGQQLVFGEQLGWLDPGLVQDPEKEFFRQMVRLRALFNRFFNAGQMARPPSLEGTLPTVKADWQWSKDWWVTTSAVLTGAWQIPAEKRLVCFFVNVSEAPVDTVWRFAPAVYGLGNAPVSVTTCNATGAVAGPVRHEGSFTWTQNLPARQALALEITY